MSLIVPEVIFINTLKSILKIVRDDFNSQVDETKSFLYKLVFGSGSLERYNFYDQLKKIIITEKDDPRAFDLSMFFNMQKCMLPHLHITLPNENSGQDGLGIDEGYADEVFDDTTQTYRKIYTRRFDTTYNFTITSDNSNEVIALYHFLRALDIVLINHFQLSGLEKIRINGGDLNLNPGIVPPNVYMRNISISFSYEINAPNLLDNDFVTKLQFSMSPEVISESEVDESDSI